MQGRTPTKAEKIWLDMVSQVGCVVCIMLCDRPDFFGTGYCEIHHIDGSVGDECHMHTLGLCTRHHRTADNFASPRWISRHGDGRVAFENYYVTETEVLKMQHSLVDRFVELVNVA